MKILEQEESLKALRILGTTTGFLQCPPWQPERGCKKIKMKKECILLKLSVKDHSRAGGLA